MGSAGDSSLMFRGATVGNNNSMAPDLNLLWLFYHIGRGFIPSDDLLIPTLSLFLPHGCDLAASCGEVQENTISC